MRTSKKLTDKQRRSRENLKPFKKGRSGNPKGRKKKELCIPDILRNILNEPLTEGEKVTKLNAIMRTVVELAIEGKPWAVEYVSSRTEGKAQEHIHKYKHEAEEVKVIW